MLGLVRWIKLWLFVHHKGRAGYATARKRGKEDTRGKGRLFLNVRNSNRRIFPRRQWRTKRFDRIELRTFLGQNLLVCTQKVRRKGVDIVVASE